MFRYTTLESFFTSNECEIILNYSLKNTELKKATVNSDASIIENIRKSSVAFLPYKIIFPNIIEKLEKELIKQVKIKGYELSFENPMYQFTEYKTGEFYDWHTDVGDKKKNRYCSVVIQLTDEYTGGELELIDDNEIIKFKKGKGNLFIFLSNLNHRVTEIKSGCRYSIVTWFTIIPIPNYSKSLI